MRKDNFSECKQILGEYKDMKSKLINSITSLTKSVTHDGKTTISFKGRAEEELTIITLNYNAETNSVWGTDSTRDDWKLTDLVADELETIAYLLVHGEYIVFTPLYLNTADNYEPIEITLTKEKYPIAFNNKVEELLEEGCFETREEAEKDVASTPIQCEVYYEKYHGLFIVEEGAVESMDTIYSPYSGEKCFVEDAAMEE